MTKLPFKFDQMPANTFLDVPNPHFVLGSGTPTQGVTVEVLSKLVKQLCRWLAFKISHLPAKRKDPNLSAHSVKRGKAGFHKAYLLQGPRTATNSLHTLPLSTRG